MRLMKEQRSRAVSMSRSIKRAAVVLVRFKWSPVLILLFCFSETLDMMNALDVRAAVSLWSVCCVLVFFLFFLENWKENQCPMWDATLIGTRRATNKNTQKALGSLILNLAPFFS